MWYGDIPPSCHTMWLCVKNSVTNVTLSYKHTNINHTEPHIAAPYMLAAFLQFSVWLRKRVWCDLVRFRQQVWCGLVCFCPVQIAGSAGRDCGTSNHGHPSTEHIQRWNLILTYYNIITAALNMNKYIRFALNYNISYCSSTKIMGLIPRGTNILNIWGAQMLNATNYYINE